jgi:resuscitation-promoting factor RpfB
VRPIASRTNCDPNYSGCVPIDSDVDCAGGSGNGPSYVRGPVQVIGVDIYDLDRDHDGIACE